MSKEFNSIREIHDALVALNELEGSTSQALAELIEVIRVNHKNALVPNSNVELIPGSGDDYHNLSVEFARSGCSLFAAQVAEFGSEVYPLNADLLADIIKYYQEVGRTSKCNEALTKLDKIDRKFWSWRSFVFVIDYYKDTLELVSSMEAFKDNIAEAQKLINEFKTYIPNDERAYLAEAELRLIQNDNKGAISILEDGIKNVKVAPQCCMKLADLYLENGDYKKVAETARKGIVATAQEQPSVSIGYLYYVLALAMDAQRQQVSFAGGEPDDTQVPGIIRNFEIADKLFVAEGRGAVSYRRTIKQKLIILEAEKGC